MDGKRFDPKSQLSKHGWTTGSGLGREEDGIREAIKVKLKFDQTGVGHNQADQFTFHWWDHTFNKAANNIQVKHTQDGVEIESGQKMEEISSKKKLVNVDKKDMLYGMFVKSSTLTMEGEVKEAESKLDKSAQVSDSTSDSDSEVEGADIGTASKLTDEQLHKICGGRTAHKGARHGLGLNGKLARIAQQESAYSATTSPASSLPSSPLTSEDDLPKEKRNKKKKKKKRKVENDEDAVSAADTFVNVPRKGKKSKKKSKCKDLEDPNVAVEDNINISSVGHGSAKSKKSRQKLTMHTEHDEEKRNKKKKSKKKSKSAENFVVEENDNFIDSVQTKKSESENNVCDIKNECNTNNFSSKKKKCKKSARKHDSDDQGPLVSKKRSKDTPHDDTIEPTRKRKKNKNNCQ